MKYQVIRQSNLDERVFTLKDEEGNTFDVDFYSGGEINPPIGAGETAESRKEWLGTFVGKTLEIEKIIPYLHFTSGKVKIIN